jgi:hypothetical protein
VHTAFEQDEALRTLFTKYGTMFTDPEFQLTSRGVIDAIPSEVRMLWQSITLNNGTCVLLLLLLLPLLLLLLLLYQSITFNKGMRLTEHCTQCTPYVRLYSSSLVPSSRFRLLFPPSLVCVPVCANYFTPFPFPL